MRIFISSVISGFGETRAAAVAAVRSLGHEPVTAETFDASTSSPRVACLGGVREADLVVVLLGQEYGAVQPNSGLSATHEEWREAKDRRPVIAFVQNGVHRESRQADFVREVEDWTGGLFRGSFDGPDDLRDSLTRALHRHELSAAAVSVDSGEMLARAQALVPRDDRGFSRMTGPLVHVAVVGGPAQTVLRPVEIEDPALARALLREATYGDHAIFDSSFGSKQAMPSGALQLTQENGAEILLDESGAIRVSVPITRGGGMLGALIEENVREALDRGLAQVAAILKQIDDAQRLSRLVLAAGLGGSGLMGWRTRREDEASPNSMTMSHGFGQGNRAPVHFQPPDRPRAALEFDRPRMGEDLVTLLRRQWK
jgi:hypothetical protein